MQPKTEELLYFLSWSIDKFLRPTFRNLNESFEGWAYRNGLLREIHTLEQRRFLERDRKSLDERVYRLTEQGRLHSLGGRDPERCWARGWDERWRLVLFDVPVCHNARRDRLRRQLRDRHFGCLQRSTWITPDRVDDEQLRMVGGEINVRSLILLEARPCTGESDSEIVAGGWDFERINRLYARHLKVLDQRPTPTLRDSAMAKALQRWGAEEREAWLAAVESDPLLPNALLPLDYMGRQSWERRRAIMIEAGQQIRTFVSKKID